MLKIRLLRVGKKHDPSYRVVVTDSRNSTKSGRFIEIVGNYNPQIGQPQFKAERIKEWVSKGAQISDTVHNLLINAKIIEGKKKDVLHHGRIKANKEKKAPKVVTNEVGEPRQEESGREESVKEPAEAIVKKPDEQPVPENTESAEVDNK
ncbi:30S ribosomal protein S16 [Patescibacteria group bacterium]|nr:30S ribosomal protein S16 [Patescibacteria group bacterium]